MKTTIIKVPQSWSEVTLEQYCDLISLGLSSKVIHDLMISLSQEDEMLKNLCALSIDEKEFDNLLVSISILCDISYEEVEVMAQTDLLEILKELSWLKPIKNETKSDIDFSKFNVGHWINIETVIEKGQIQDNIIEILLKITKEDCSQMPVIDVIHHLNDFLTYRKDLFKKFEGLFTDVDDTEDVIKDSSEIMKESFQKKWGWMSFIDTLAEGDVTKYEYITEMNFVGSLNIVSFKTEKSRLK